MSTELREEHAKRLLNDKLFQEAFTTLRESLLQEWESTGQHDIDKRESLYTSVKLIDRLWSHIETILDTGKVLEFKKQHPFV